MTSPTPDTPFQVARRLLVQIYDETEPQGEPPPPGLGATELASTSEDEANDSQTDLRRAAVLTAIELHRGKAPSTALSALRQGIDECERRGYLSTETADQLRKLKSELTSML